MWSVRQTKRFARQYKKLRDNTAADVDAAVLVVQSDPHGGERKNGDLASLWVHKFRSGSQLYLLGYTLDDASSWCTWKPSVRMKISIETLNADIPVLAHR